MERESKTLWKKKKNENLREKSGTVLIKFCSIVWGVLVKVKNC